MKKKSVEQLVGISRACCAISVSLCGCFAFQELERGKKSLLFFLKDLELLGMGLLKCLAQTYKNVMNIYQPRPKIDLPALYHQSSC